MKPPATLIFTESLPDSVSIQAVCGIIELPMKASAGILGTCDVKIIGGKDFFL